ncbi:MAG: class I SAM-dependent methyltransferase [Candidatus Omnitrophota bacterium]
MTLRKAQNASQFYLLDIGAGSGGLLHSINTDKSLKLFVKTSAFEIEESERIIKQQNGIDWEFGETAENLPQSWSNKFNIVFLTYVLEYAYNPLKIIEEIYRVLALNGEAFLSLALFNEITYKRGEKYFHFGSYGFDAGNIYFEGIDFWVEINQFRKRGYAIGIYVKQLSEGEYYLREVDQSLWNIFNKGVNIFPPDEKVRPEESVFLIRIKKNKPEPLIFNYEVTKVDNLIHRRFDLKRAASPISSVNDSAENSKIRTVPISIDMIFEEYNIMYIEARKVRGAVSPLAKPRRAAAGSPIDSHDGGSELFPPICADSLSGVKLGDSRICLCNLKSPNQKIVLRKTSDTDYPAKYNIYLDKQCVGGLIYYNAPQMIKVKNLTISNASAKRGIGQSVMCFIADSVRESIGGDRLVGISGTTSAENIHNFCKFFKNIVYGSLDDPIPANEEELLNRLGRGALTFRGIPKSKEEIALVLQDNDKKTYSSSPVITDKAGKDIDKRGPHELSIREKQLSETQKKEFEILMAHIQNKFEEAGTVIGTYSGFAINDAAAYLAHLTLIMMAIAQNRPVVNMDSFRKYKEVWEEIMKKHNFYSLYTLMASLARSFPVGNHTSLFGDMKMSLEDLTAEFLKNMDRMDVLLEESSFHREEGERCASIAGGIKSLLALNSYVEGLPKIDAFKAIALMGISRTIKAGKNWFTLRMARGLADIREGDEFLEHIYGVVKVRAEEMRLFLAYDVNKADMLTTIDAAELPEDQAEEYRKIAGAIDALLYQTRPSREEVSRTHTSSPVEGKNRTVPISRKIILMAKKYGVIIMLLLSVISQSGCATLISGNFTREYATKRFLETRQAIQSKDYIGAIIRYSTVYQMYPEALQKPHLNREDKEKIVGAYLFIRSTIEARLGKNVEDFLRGVDAVRK